MQSPVCKAQCADALKAELEQLTAEAKAEGLLDSSTKNRTRPGFTDMGIIRTAFECANPASPNIPMSLAK